MTIINLNKHQATAEQVAQGVVDLARRKPCAVQPQKFNFVGMPTNGDIHDRAFDIARIASESGAEAAMIGGAPYLMPTCKRHCNRAVLQYFYAFSERVSVERL